LEQEELGQVQCTVVQDWTSRKENFYMVADSMLNAEYLWSKLKYAFKFNYLVKIRVSVQGQMKDQIYVGSKIGFRIQGKN
jgi:hypothetical protein